MTKPRKLTIALAAAALWMAAPALGQAKFETLGAVAYEAKVQRAVIDVDRKAGGYTGLRIDVAQGDVEVLDLKVIYGNGVMDDIKVRQLFRAGTSSRVIELKGGTRQIQQIIVTYLPRGPVKMAFLGVAAPLPKWEQLGCKEVSFFVDRDIIKVGRKEGNFRAIRIDVKLAPIEIFDLRVVFGNGQRQDIRVRSLIKPGQDPRPFDLAGDARGIDRIEMVYRSLPTFKGKAAVCVGGLQR